MSGTGAELYYEQTVPAVFVRRLNRFVAEVRLEGRTEKVHVKNTGRLAELLVPEAAVTLQKATAAERKTAYDLISVYKPGLAWVNIDSLAPNELMKRYLAGLVAGCTTRTGAIGYVAATNIPEVVRGIDAFALGVRRAAPEAKVYVRYIGDWSDDDRARQ